MEHLDLTIIGGGVIGLASAWECRKKFPDKSIALLEKGRLCGEAQSTRNSGVLHSGYPYRPGSKKATDCMRGNDVLRQFAGEHGIPYVRTKKITVAVNDEQEQKLDAYLARAAENRVDALKLRGGMMLNYEPNVRAQAAMLTPFTGVIDAASFVRTLEKLVKESGVHLLKQAEVKSIHPLEESFDVAVEQQGDRYNFISNYIINAAGVHADEIGKMINPDFPYVIKPLRGEYMKFNKKSRPELWMNGLNVYPVPHPIPRMYDQFGNPAITLGAHLTPTLEYDTEGNATASNTVLVGPLSSVVEDKEDLHTNRKPKQAFLERVVGYFPSLREEDLEEDQCGIQVRIQGYDDFVRERDVRHPNAIHAIADSPGLTASLVFGQEVAGMVG